MNDYFNLIQTHTWKREEILPTTFTEQLSRVYLDRNANVLVLGWNHESISRLVLDNTRVNKVPFSTIFYLKYIGLNKDQITAKIGYQNHH